MKRQNARKVDIKTKQDGTVKQQANVKVEAFRHLNFDEISDEESPNQITSFIFEQRKITREQDEPLSVKLKNYIKKLEMGRVEIDLIDPEQVGIFGNKIVYKSKNFGPYIIDNVIQGGILAISSAEIQMYKQINLPFCILKMIKPNDEYKQH